MLDKLDLTTVSSVRPPSGSDGGWSWANRKQTIGEYMELRPDEPIVLKFFSGHDVLDLAAKLPFQGLHEEAQEQVGALRTVMQRATSDNPPHCVICDDVTVFPSLGYARSASKSPVGAVFVICTPCSMAAESADDLRVDIVAALGEKELKASTWAS
jgi:hypothetical protein